MKTSDYLVLAGAALAAYMILNRGAFANTLAPKSGGLRDFVNGIFNSATVGQPGFGWQYFENGTAIDPAGNYYYQGVKVWTNEG